MFFINLASVPDAILSKFDRPMPLPVEEDNWELALVTSEALDLVGQSGR